MSTNAREVTVSVPASLAAQIEAAITRGDAGSVGEFVATAIHHELLRLREEAESRTGLPLPSATDAEPEEVGIGWGDLMQSTEGTTPIPIPPEPGNET